MSSFFYRSKALILIFTLVSMMFVLGGTAFVKNSGVIKPFKEVSTDSIVGGITANNEVENKHIFDAIVKSGRKSNEFIFAIKMNSINSIAIYYTSSKQFDKELIRGRAFTQQDFDKHADTVMISSDIEKKCIRIKDILYFEYAGDKYEVIGVYSSNDKEGDKHPDCYFNYYARSLDPTLYKNFVFDAGKESSTIWDNLTANINELKSKNIALEYVPLDSVEGTEFEDSMTNFAGMQGILIITAILVLLNAVSVSINWLAWYKKEIGIRRLHGASKGKISCWIIGNMLVYVAVSFTFGVILSTIFLIITEYLPVAESVQLMFGNNISLQGVIIGLGFILLLCGSIIAITINYYNRNTIKEILSWADY